ncbi:MAG: RsmB/NOP family class I SAM-dependent RNA methyltransferase [Nanoarchaeota archaeon]|nr:RsmB/NOP family class I SAM-dependent RNA methyltransferase [Nanoarchaeota archaeon]
MEFKPRFQEKYQHLTELAAYKIAIHEQPRRSIRINTLISNVTSVKQELENQGYALDQIPWCNEGFYVGKGPEALGNTEAHLSGRCFIQASVSMIPSIILNPGPEDTTLDCCAAPGGKTTHLAMLMQNQGIIVANETDRKRIGILIDNIQRMHAKNVVVTKTSAEKLTGNYTKILLDAPCSASGNIYGVSKTSKKTLLEWNQNTVNRLAILQRKLISHAYQLLQPKGTLVYSTCSLEPEEDEHVIQHLLDTEPTAKLEKIELPIKVDWNNGIKIWPQYNHTEGFFISKITKKN